MGFFDWLSGGKKSRMPEIRLSKRAAAALTFGEWTLSGAGLPTTRVTYNGGKGLRGFVGSSTVTFAAYDEDGSKLGESQTDMAYLEVGQTGKITIPLDNLDEEELDSVAYLVIDIDA